MAEGLVLVPGRSDPLVERVGEELIERLGLRRLARQAQRPIRRVS
jgi:hypothetical protein